MNGEHCATQGQMKHGGFQEPLSVPVPDGQNSPRRAAFCLQIRGLEPSKSISTGEDLSLTDLTERRITKVPCRKHSESNQYCFFASRWKSHISIFGFNVNVERILSLQLASSKGQLIKFARSKTSGETCTPNFL